MGAKEIVYYETTKTYEGVPKGLRFKVVLDNSKHMYYSTLFANLQGTDTFFSCFLRNTIVFDKFRK